MSANDQQVKSQQEDKQFSKGSLYDTNKEFNTSTNTASEILAMPTLQLTITQIHTPPEQNPEPTSFPEPDPEPAFEPTTTPADEPEPATDPEPTPSTLPPELDPEAPSRM